MNDENRERLITTGELSRLVGCHPATIHQWVKQGVIMEVRSMDSRFQHRVGPSQLTDFKSEYCKNKLK